jgi:AraC-like DNA-binding protein
MRPTFEKVNVETGTSWTLLNRRLASGIPFEWHHHPEFELTLTLNSRGHRLIGDHVGTYDDGDLVLIGPSLPHSWCSHSAVDNERPHVALVAWFKEAWAANVVATFAELAPLTSLLSDARRGVQFSVDVARKARPLVEQFPTLAAADRLLVLMRVLQILAGDTERCCLSSPIGEGFAPAASDQRIRKVLDHLHERYRDPLIVTDLARVACLSQSALNRLFRRHTRLTPIEYVTRLRIGCACSALIAGNQNIAAVAALAGYRNLSNFNRQFLAIKGMNPRSFQRVAASGLRA